jgi:hypothetical protein
VGGVRGLRGRLGGEIPCNIGALVIGMGAVHDVSQLRRGDPQGAVLHQRDRVAQRQTVVNKAPDTPNSDTSKTPS